MTSYAAMKGRASPVANAVTPQPARQLTETEKDRAENNRQFVLEHMPELLPTIRQLHAEGLIDGWRSVVSCTMFDRYGSEQALVVMVPPASSSIRRETGCF